ncbi:MAG: DUF4349 domain-containing protein [Planctomycetes bacterium]|jgi:hypothetical protein|nr:DUF4349 domain-containing protein [Planctomycetota bacterium]
MIRSGILILSILGAIAAPGCASAAAARPEHEAARRTFDVAASLGAGMAEGLVAAQPDAGEAARHDLAVITDFHLAGAPGEPGPGAARRFIVYSGAFRLATGSVPEALDAARKLAESLGGHFQSLEESVITIRVPAARWDEALARLPSLGRILSRRIEAADVTDEVVDLSLRLKNARALGDRLAELLAKATTVEETLAVEKELTRIRTEIESLEGKLAVLRDRVALSTLVLTFVPAGDAPVRPQALPFPWLAELSLERLLGLSGGGR